MTMFEHIILPMMAVLTIYNAYIVSIILRDLRILHAKMIEFDTDSIKRTLKIFDYIDTYMENTNGKHDFEPVIESQVTSKKHFKLGKPKQATFNQHNFSTREGEHDHV